ncbi:hypothetical protein [Thermospira aquatica]|uniref:Uncharacterized protein n=1 Tax=Thermospira aquatica TaxID=2828656 RepID=A0AAX3BA99_9SPIR|nr:hypothetical protein [Thermospira aquatica]URA09179.1 hypothetical protein KDW03_06620 [Thermospira aquatica]
MGTLEEKKKKLGIDQLDIQEQKEIFEEFVRAGGKVVNLESDPSVQLSKKLSEFVEAKEAQRRAAEKRTSMSSSSSTRQPANQTKKANEKETHVSRWDLFWERFAAKWICILYGIFNFWGTKFSHHFLSLLGDIEKLSTINHQIFTSLFYQDKAFSYDLRQKLHEIGLSHYYELIYRLDMIYDVDFFRLVRQLLMNPPNPLLIARNNLVKLFKALLILDKYKASLNIVVEKVLMTEQTMRSLEPITVNKNIQIVNQNIYKLFYTIFPRLLYLADYYYKDMRYMGKFQSFKEFLNFNETDEIGYYTRRWAEEDEQERRRREELERQKALEEQMAKEMEEAMASNDGLEGLPEPVRLGMRILRESLNFREVMDNFKSIRDPRSLLPIEDKAFIAITLLEFFDKSYSFLFISNQIQFNIFFDAGSRRDYRSVFKDLYFHIDDIYKLFSEYVKNYVELQKIDTSLPRASKEHYAKQQKLELERSQSSRKIRQKIQSLLHDFSLNLKIIFEDYEKDRKILHNPDEILSIENRILSKKITTKTSVINMFSQAYYVASAIDFLISEGEIGGYSLEVKTPILLSQLKTNE